MSDVCAHSSVFPTWDFKVNTIYSWDSPCTALSAIQGAMTSGFGCKFLKLGADPSLSLYLSFLQDTC